MKILYLGDLVPGQTCRMRMRALERLGHEVCGVHTIEPWRRASWLARQVERRTGVGTIVRQINKSVLDAARQFHPELVWADKQECLWPETLKRLRSAGARLVHFTPDPYFTLDWKRTALMDQAIHQFDVLVFCKEYERTSYEALGKHLIYMPLGFCDEQHHPIPSTDPRWNSTVGFLGGWEPRREGLLRVAASICPDTKLWGGHWGHVRDGKWTIRRRIILGQLAADERVKIRKDELLARIYQGNEVYGEDYAKALTGAKIGLGLLRLVCPDQHTTRTFEIPACGSMLLADRTAEHQSFFVEGTEAEFFSSREEFRDKLRFYSGNETARSRVAANGRERCRKGNYAYIHRMKAALEEALQV